MGTLSQGELEDYLNEFRDYLDSSANLEEEEPLSNSEESEQDAEWLREAGFEFLVDFVKDDKEENDICDGIMATLTHQQAATVRRKYEKFKDTGRRRRYVKSRLPDVRDVFANNIENAILQTATLPEESTSTIETDSLRQTSVDEARSLYRSEPNLHEESKHKSHWREHFRSGNSYKLTHFFSSGAKSETGVEVLSYQARSSIKEPVARPRFGRQTSLGNLPPQPELETYLEEPVEQQEYEFELDERSQKTDELPEVKMIQNYLGITYTIDIGAEDMRKIHSLALIEVTDLFDKHGVTYSRRKAVKRKLQDGVIFGVPLSVLVQQDRKISHLSSQKISHNSSHTPWIFEKLVSHLERRGLCEEGILRIPGSRQKIESLKCHIEKYSGCHSGQVEEVLEMATVHDVAAVLKQFVRELPEPLLANAYLDAFLHVPDIPYVVDQLKALNLLIVLLPDTHRETLKRLVDFLGLVAASEYLNKMSLQNVSVIMAPNFFPPRGQPSDNLKRDLTSEMMTAALCAKVTKMLIKYRHVLWTIPPGLLKQIRQQHDELAHNKNNKDNRAKRLVKKNRVEVIDKDRSYSAGSDQPLRSVQVHFPADGTQRCLVDIDGSTTAGDVVEFVVTSYGCESLKVPNERDAPDFTSVQTLTDRPITRKKQHEHFLYEEGGNIGKRRVDSKARMMAIMKQNPFTDWKIRCHAESLL